MLSKKEIEQMKQIRELDKKIKVMRVLATDFGFFICYLALNEVHKDKEFSFNSVNELYKDLFDEYRFKSLNDFFEKGLKFKLN